MKPSPRRILLAAWVLSAVTPCLVAQDLTPTQGKHGETDLDGVRILHQQPRPLTSPFPLGAKGADIPALTFLAPEQMAAADRALVDQDQEEIERRANLQGFRLGDEAQGQAAWGYEQAVCPVFPEHVVLEYSRDNGAGDITLFAVVLPRGEGHVRVIPVRRRSYSLFTPAPANELTINDFNQMVKEQGHGVDPDWMTLGLCYAALAGGHVRAALQALTPDQEHYPLFYPAKLTLSYKTGGAEIHFADVTPHTKAMDWELLFGPSGRLLKVKHTVSTELVETPVSPKALPPWTPTRQAIVEIPKPGN